MSLPAGAAWGLSLRRPGGRACPRLRDPMARGRTRGDSRDVQSTSLLVSERSERRGAPPGRRAPHAPPLVRSSRERTASYAVPPRATLLGAPLANLSRASGGFRFPHSASQAVLPVSQLSMIHVSRSPSVLNVSTGSSSFLRRRSPASSTVMSTTTTYCNLIKESIRRFLKDIRRRLRGTYAPFPSSVDYTTTTTGQRRNVPSRRPITMFPKDQADVLCPHHFRMA